MKKMTLKQTVCDSQAYNSYETLLLNESNMQQCSQMSETNGSFNK